MHLKDFMEATSYRITEGAEWYWASFPDAYRLTSSKYGVYDVTVVFSTTTQDVYLMETFDEVKQNMYRWVNPLFDNVYKAEHLEKGVSYSVFIDAAIDRDGNTIGESIEYIDVEEDDLLEKTYAITNMIEYDERVLIPLDVDDETLFALMKMAHEKDITLNELVEGCLKDELHRLKIK